MIWLRIGIIESTCEYGIEALGSISHGVSYSQPSHLIGCYDVVLKLKVILKLNMSLQVVALYKT